MSVVINTHIYYFKNNRFVNNKIYSITNNLMPMIDLWIDNIVLWD